MNELFKKTKLGNLKLRNRIFKAATFEGMSPEGIPGNRLMEHHAAIIRGGAAMTTVAYCAVSINGRTFTDQIYLHEGIKTELRALCDAVHQEGGAICAQLFHCGSFSRNKKMTIKRPLAPCNSINILGAAAGIPFAKGMDESEFKMVLGEYNSSAGLAKSAVLILSNYIWPMDIYSPNLLVPVLTKERILMEGGLKTD